MDYTSGRDGWGVGGVCKHLVNGSPENPCEQEHIGLWSSTLHTANTPQLPGQGSRHLDPIQARLGAQAELSRHSALQPCWEVGSPW